MTKYGNAKVKSYHIARNWAKKLESFQTESVIPTSYASSASMNAKFSKHFTGHGSHAFMLFGMNFCGLGLKNCDLCEGCVVGETPKIPVEDLEASLSLIDFVFNGDFETAGLQENTAMISQDGKITGKRIFKQNKVELDRLLSGLYKSFQATKTHVPDCEAESEWDRSFLEWKQSYEGWKQDFQAFRTEL